VDDDASDVANVNFPAACNQISAFMNQVRAQSGKSLPAMQAGQWLASATQLKTMAGCS
jgi:hypothetical protein